MPVVKSWYFIIVFVIAILSYAVPIAIYFLFFRHRPLPEAVNSWGALGSFISGISGAFLSIVNIGVLLFLTYLAAHFNDVQNEKNIKAQRVLQINDMRFTAYKEFTKIFLPINFDNGDSIDVYSSSQLRSIMLDLNYFFESNQFLFQENIPSMLPEYTKTYNALSGMNNAIVDWHKHKDIKFQDEYRHKYVELLNACNGMRVMMQVSILHGHN